MTLSRYFFHYSLSFVIILLLSLYHHDATAQDLSFNPIIKVTKSKINADLENIIISMDPKSTRLGNVYIEGQDFNNSFQTVLNESIIRSAMFNDASSYKIALFVQVRKLEYYQSESVISYELIDKRTGKNFYLQYFVVDKNELAKTKRNEAIFRSVENNIRKFLNSLDDSNIEWPGGKRAGTSSNKAKSNNSNTIINQPNNARKSDKPTNDIKKIDPVDEKEDSSFKFW
ncbi:MAG: hypothetical protein K0U39_04165 [Alphaproteobacteria bacterium]|nr:hypothetical protein [Alphaproteobacteria bacterium]